MTAALVLLCAMILDAVLGEPDWLWSRIPHPAVLMGRFVGFLDRVFNQGGSRRIKGCACLVVLISTALAIGYGIALLGPVAQIITTAVLLAQKSLVDHVKAVSTGLRIGLPEGCKAVALIVGRDTAEMDETQTARAAIESAAENLSDGVIAPIFWFLISGLPGLVTYKFINTADSMIGYRTSRHEAFGWAAARSDDLMNLVPARLTAVLLALSAKQFDIVGIRADAQQHRSPNAGWPEAAMSRALGIALSGPRAYGGEKREFPWVNGSGRKSLSSEDIDASVLMLWKAWGLIFTLIVLGSFWTA